MLTTSAHHVSHKTILLVTFFFYAAALVLSISNHEMWGDEIHSWNIAKGSHSYIDLLRNSRFEGHPPVWYSILWMISKFTHNLTYVQIVHGLIASATVGVILFRSPIHLLAKILIPFGYYFLYEYSTLSRNYAVGILLACCICLVIRKEFRFKPVVYYGLLLLMTNTHLLAIILAGSLHLYFLILNVETKRSRVLTAVHLALGILVFMPSLYFIFPPSDSQLNTQYWLDRWSPEQIKVLGQAPLRSFIPVPAWWDPHSWNTQLLLDSRRKSRLVNLVAALVPLVIAIVIFARNKKSLAVFLSNLFVSFMVALVVFPLTSARYAGFLFIGFIISYWLFCYEVIPTKRDRYLINGLLVVQLIASILSIVNDARKPFSNAYRVVELLDKPGRGQVVVTDYWAMNPIAAFGDRSIYCIDVEKDLSFVLWGPDLGKMFAKSNRYATGVKNLFRRHGIHTLYMISTGSLEALGRVDAALQTQYRVELVDKRDGAIEKGGNLYLYRISENYR